MIKAIVTDIEGTTTSLSFVKDVLFPYSRQHLREFVESHSTEPRVLEVLADVSCMSGIESEINLLVDQLIAWIDADQKVTPLKTLQGWIWSEGYNAGQLKGHIYQDVPEVLRGWKQKGMQLYIYSSGSVDAQKLLFSHTDYGDLTPLFSGYFDTNTGGKRERASYQKISVATGYLASEMLFLSDIIEELDAASLAGFQTIQLLREGESSEISNHRRVASFNEITL